MVIQTSRENDSKEDGKYLAELAEANLSRINWLEGPSDLKKTRRQKMLEKPWAKKAYNQQKIGESKKDDKLEEREGKRGGGGTNHQAPQGVKENGGVLLEGKISQKAAKTTCSPLQTNTTFKRHRPGRGKCDIALGMGTDRGKDRPALEKEFERKAKFGDAVSPRKGRLEKKNAGNRRFDDQKRDPVWDKDTERPRRPHSRRKS